MADDDTGVKLEGEFETIDFSEQIKGKGADEIVEILESVVATSEGVLNVLETTDKLEKALTELIKGGYSGVVLRKDSKSMKLFYRFKDYGTVAKQLSLDEINRLNTIISKRVEKKLKNVYPVMHKEILWILYAMDESNPLYGFISTSNKPKK